jgi:hypothetical protein
MYTEPKKTTTPSRTNPTSSSGNSGSARSTASTTHKTTTPRKTTTTTSIKITPPVIEERKKETYSYSYTSLFPQPEPAPYVPPKPKEPKEPDENTPKSTPKHANDQYIRKRMIIAGSSYCNADILVKLEVGTYFELEAEPDNPHDKDAVKLTLEGEKIGYIAKADRLPFVTCLKLKRKVYGVITDIITESFTTKYEFETWFDLSK